MWIGAAATATAATTASSPTAVSTVTPAAALVPGECVYAFPVNGDYGAEVCTPW